jgi:16S rRNA (guanine1516-N2)-methyltransferase
MAQSRQSSLAVLPAAEVDQTVAAGLAQRLGLSLLPAGADPRRNEQLDAVLVTSGDALYLQQTGRAAPGPVAADFGGTAMRYRRRGGHNELLGKAVGVGKKTPLRVLDATAGLGRDSFVLADLGCNVILSERHPVIVEILQAGMCVAQAQGDSWLDEVLGRMRLCPGDAREASTGILAEVDAIYLDPMFPQRDKSAAVKKEMALFQLLLDDNDAGQDADELLLWALLQDVARVVVKRPPRAPDLAGRPPSHCINGKAVRYDVYVLRKF